jgi:hypothetical protein
MTTEQIIAEIDAEIARLRKVRALLSPRPSQDNTKPVRKHRKLSAASRRKIAAAQKARWVKQKAAK